MTWPLILVVDFELQVINESEQDLERYSCHRNSSIYVNEPRAKPHRKLLSTIVQKI